MGVWECESARVTECRNSVRLGSNAIHMKPLLLILLLILLLSLAEKASGATSDATRRFLRGYRHSWCPYALPAETDLAQIMKVADLGFDTVGVSFVGPYDGGAIDFSTLDEAIDAIGKRGQKVVIHIAPRFSEKDDVHDRLSNGKDAPHISNRSPNYCFLDIFDPRQRRLFCDYVRRCAERYGRDERVAAFVIGWGYMGETGFYNGDFLADFAKQGSECAGYSSYALAEFNRWRKSHGLPPVSKPPLPSTSKQSGDYILFHRFRCEFVREVFHREMLDAAKAHTDHPVGTFAYLSASPDSYARNWTDSPNADFYRSAASAASFDLTRTLIDSGVGWEDAWLHDGDWRFTSAEMMRDEARQIAKGAVFHAMYIKVYETEPQWEKGVFEKVCAFLKTQDLAADVRREKATIALYQPTWGAAALPGRSESQPFVPRVGHSMYITKMQGLVESFGLPYALITEADLLDPKRLKGFAHVIVPMWDLTPNVLGEGRARELAKDGRIIGIPLRDKPLNRSEFRELLKKNGVRTKLDFDSDLIVVGRYANLVYSWYDQPISVRVPERAEPFALRPSEYAFVE